MHARDPKADMREWGVEPGYRGDDGDWHEAPGSTLESIGGALGASGDAGPPAGDAPVLFVGPGDRPRIDREWDLVLEDGTTLAVDGEVPEGLPFGYHGLSNRSDGRRRSLIVTPRRCRLPSGGRSWGWAVQLPGLRSRDSWGIGDLADLRRLGEWSAGLGASATLVSPLHASRPGLPQQPSPYFPSSRCWRNPIYLRVEEVPGAAALGSDELARLADAGRALDSDRLIVRDRVWELKLGALERVWDGFGGDPDFDRYCKEQGSLLRSYAAFCAMTEVQGGTWREWPPGVRHPEGSGVEAFVSGHQRRVGFHQWLQWVLDRQVAAAGADTGLVHDLAVGVDPAGADAWTWQDLIAPGVSVGAPPDGFNRQGQDWGLPPFDPWKLRDAGYEPFVRMLRANLRRASGLRVDHVMGLFRLYWIPEGDDPARGAYVRYPWSDLLDLVALESERAGAFVVGEDLGTVEPFVRDELARRRVLSSRVLWFEDEGPAFFPDSSIASVSTHDLPTVAGLWSGADLSAQQRIGLSPDADAVERVRSRLRDQLGVSDEAGQEEVIARTHRLLASAPSVVAVASLEDALGVEERPNMPGTTEAWPNWSLALPLPLEEILTDPRVAGVAETMRSRTGGHPGPAARRGALS